MPTDSSYWSGRETGQIESNSILDNAIAYSLRLFANILYFLIFDVADAYTLTLSFITKTDTTLH